MLHDGGMSYGDYVEQLMHKMLKNDARLHAVVLLIVPDVPFLPPGGLIPLREIARVTQTQPGN